MNVQLQNTRGYGAHHGVKILVYGRAKRGKTTLCATCPNPVIISAERGLLSLAGHDLPYINVETVAQLTDAYAWVKGSAEARQFETVCVDSITEIAETVLATAKVGKKDPRQAYGSMIDDVTKTIKDFRDLPGKHVYMSAKQATVDYGNGVAMAGPMMPGKQMGQAVPYLPDEIFQIEINDGPPRYHYLRCQPDFMNEAGDRSGRLDEIEEPHLGKIIAKITQNTK